MEKEKWSSLRNELKNDYNVKKTKAEFEIAKAYWNYLILILEEINNKGINCYKKKVALEGNLQSLKDKMKENVMNIELTEEEQLNNWKNINKEFLSFKLLWDEVQKNLEQITH